MMQRLLIALLIALLATSFMLTHRAAMAEDSILPPHEIILFFVHSFESAWTAARNGEGTGSPSRGFMDIYRVEWPGMYP